MKNKILIFFVLALSLVAFASAEVPHGDARIVLSTPNSLGTGIAISENDVWLLDEIPSVLIGRLHTIKFTIENKNEYPTAHVRIIAKIGTTGIADYYVDVVDSYTDTINFEIAGFECNSLKNITLEVKDTDTIYGGEDYTQRTVRIICNEEEIHYCGDDRIDEGEECDDGNNVNEDGCSSSCLIEEGESELPVCGNGIKETGEECDDENLLNNDGCSSSCKTEQDYCGDGIKKGEEECDDGNSVNTDGCRNNCKLPYCGDGIVNGEERCDDGNTVNTDMCTNECTKPFEIITEDFEPLVWQCDHRVVYDDGTEPGRTSDDGKEMVERINNYAFEGEQIAWKVLVMDKNGIDKVGDVYVSVDEKIEANCQRIDEYLNNAEESNGEANNYIAELIDTNTIIYEGGIDPSCNARILEERLKQFDKDTMAYYICLLTIETPESMYGPADITVEAEDLDGIIGKMVEKEHWFLNPFIELYINGNITFESIKEGTSGYSERILVGNYADDGSGVILDMFISGTDFYDPTNSGAKCEESNFLGLDNFKYYATSGAYSTHDDSRADAEGYVPIKYGIGFNDPNPFYNNNEIIQANKLGEYYTSNILSPGSEMSLIFRLDLPEPCNGDFNAGQIYLWGEAI